MKEHMAAGHWGNVIEALEAEAVTGADPGPFKRHETHGSVVLVSGNVAYKLKKPVTFESFDYGTSELRGEMCRRELELNRRLAPGIYLEAMPVFDTADGYTLGSAADAEAADADGPVEWLVAMRPIASDDVLARRIDRRRGTPDELKRVGQVLARFHLGADLADPALASPDEMARQLAARMDILRKRGSGEIDEACLDSARRLAQGWLDRHGERLAARAENGWVRDGHGDLRLEHVVVADGSIQVVDCVEFNPALRACDVLADLAFLVMELELAERSDLVAALAEAWADAGGPLEWDALWFFAAFKALVRVEVGILRANQLNPGYQRDLVVELAESQLSLARRLAWRAHGPTAVVLSGLSGSGKTAVSSQVAELWGWDRVASDDARKQLVGVGRDELAPDDAYEDYVSEAVYEHLGNAAAAALDAGRSIVVDATFRRQADRSRFLRALTDGEPDRAARLAPVQLDAHDDVLRIRVADRAEREGSDANVSVLEEQLAARPPAKVPFFPDSVEIGTSAPLDTVLTEIEIAILERMATAVDSPR